MKWQRCSPTTFPPDEQPYGDPWGRLSGRVVTTEWAGPIPQPEEAP